ncbi:hypothetical protein [Streptomyces mirabilis]|uniref:hypothetical protein n=1 Tax=Streptomyces mirabilis TaxID=68239 RepID=UPI00369435F0
MAGNWEWLRGLQPSIEVPEQLCTPTASPELNLGVQVIGSNIVGNDVVELAAQYTRCAVVRGVDDREGVLDLDSFFVLPDVLADEGAVEGVRTLGDRGGEGADGGGRGRRGGGYARRGGLRGGLLGGEWVGRGEPGHREAADDGDGAAADEDPAPLDALVPTVFGGAPGPRSATGVARGFRSWVRKLRANLRKLRCVAVNAMGDQSPTEHDSQGVREPEGRRQ